LGLIDVVDSGGAQIIDLEANTISDNVEAANHHRRDGDKNWADRNIFSLEDVSRADVTATTYTQTDHNLSHEQTGFDGGIEASIQAAATTNGAPF